MLGRHGDDAVGEPRERQRGAIRQAPGNICDKNPGQSVPLCDVCISARDLQRSWRRRAKAAMSFTIVAVVVVVVVVGVGGAGVGVVD